MSVTATRPRACRCRTTAVVVAEILANTSRFGATGLAKMNTSLSVPPASRSASVYGSIARSSRSWPRAIRDSTGTIMR
mgnify:CR=1 FL=1